MFARRMTKITANIAAAVLFIFLVENKAGGVLIVSGIDWGSHELLLPGLVRLWVLGSLLTRARGKKLNWREVPTYIG